jgi:hypothetical protein
MSITLDMHRAGVVINTALELTGDLSHVACSMAGVV